MTLDSSTISRYYVLLVDEPIGEGMRRLAVGRVDGALEWLDRASVGPDKAVHEARKNIKRARSALRMVRGAIGRPAFERENALFRAAGTLLGPARDAEIKFETLEAERPVLERALGRERLGAWKEELLRERAAQIVRLLDERADEVTAILETGRAAICDWPIHDFERDVLDRGLERSDRKGAKRFARAVEEPTPEASHALRRRAKDLRHQLEVLRNVEPDLVARRLGPVHRLTDILGDHNNLAVLSADAGGREAIIGAGRADTVQAALAGRMMVLREEALELGRKLYAPG